MRYIILDTNAGYFYELFTTTFSKNKALISSMILDENKLKKTKVK